MPDETTKPDGTTSSGDSHFWGITIRAWLALWLIGAVIAHSLAVVAVVVVLVCYKLITVDQAVAALKVSEPLYTMSGMALSFYFGQQTGGKQQQKPTT